MPQLDVFIFINTGIYLFLGFFMILAYNHLYILPSIGSLLKIRRKVEKKKLSSIKESVIKLDIKPLNLENYYQKS